MKWKHLLISAALLASGGLLGAYFVEHGRSIAAANESNQAVQVAANSTAATATATPATPLVSAGLPDFTNLVAAVGPSVVNIRTTDKVQPQRRNGRPHTPGMDPQFEEFLRRFFGGNIPGFPGMPGDQGNDNGGDGGDEQDAPDQGGNSQERPVGVGSGFIWTSDGYVLTNAHVVDGADNIYVTLTNKKEYKAKVIGVDKRTDVAVVKMDAKDLPAIKIGNSKALRVGQWVVAIGSPFNLENTVTAGIVSATSRETGEFLPFIQTDVAVNPGNSGGPLINLNGEVVGINSQIFTRSGGWMGISFSIPIDEAVRVAEQLREHGRVVRGKIGAQIGNLTKDLAESLGLPDEKGAVVSSLEKDSPAAKAGVKPGDVVLAFNGKEVANATDLPRIVTAVKPGTKAPIVIWRDGKKQTLDVTVGEWADETASARNQEGNGKEAPPASEKNSLGLSVRDLSSKQLSEMGLAGGVEVVRANGSAAQAGVRKGDVIVSLNNVGIKDSADFNARVSKLPANKSAVLLLRRGAMAVYILVQPRQG